MFRFLPYDKTLPPMVVGCSARNLMYNVQAIVEPLSSSAGSTTLARGNLIQSGVTDEEIFLTTYAYDSQKELRKEFAEHEVCVPFTQTKSRLHVVDGFTFHIDPYNTLDVDDAVTVHCQGNCEAIVWIHIADVDAWVPAASPLDLNAQKRATSFYTHNGEAVAPMLPRALSEGAASLLSGEPHPRPAVSLRLAWNGSTFTDKSWHLTMVKTQKRFTYETAQDDTSKEMQVLFAIAKHLAMETSDSHEVVAKLMILYNTEVGKLLKEAGLGLLRRHPLPKQERLSAVQEFVKTFPGLQNLVFEAAEYCFPFDSNTFHAGLGEDAYAYASSPLRRYADLVNQRALKSILTNQEHKPVEASLLIQLNRREKQAKAFQRDWFFSSALMVPSVAVSTAPTVKGLVLAEQNAKGKVDVYVDVWRRTIKVRELEPRLKRGDNVVITWYEDRKQPRWKERIVFSAKTVIFICPLLFSQFFRQVI
jgi:exoribonuclease R